MIGLFKELTAEVHGPAEFLAFTFVTVPYLLLIGAIIAAIALMPLALLLAVVWKVWKHLAET